nr:MAG TPA: hypothetical protein [Caudoviricetes sp.]
MSLIIITIYIYKFKKISIKVLRCLGNPHIYS